MLRNYYVVISMTASALVSPDLDFHLSLTYIAEFKSLFLARGVSIEFVLRRV